MKRQETDTGGMSIGRPSRSRVACLGLLVALVGAVVGSSTSSTLGGDYAFAATGKQAYAKKGRAPSTTASTTTTISAPTDALVPPATGAAWRGAGLVSLPQACGDIEELGLTWYYNWGTTPACSTANAPFVPMVWGDWCPAGQVCTAPSLPIGSRELLTFNEPDVSSQSNMTVARALQLWPALEQTGLRLGSPAVSTGDTAWLDAFMAGAKQKQFRVDFLALHWYGDCSSGSNLIAYLAAMEARYGLPIWLTEFSCWNQSRAVNTAFAQQVLPQLRALSYVERIGWFTNRLAPDYYQYPAGYEGTNMVDDAGAPTSVGTVYAEAPGVR